MNIQDFSMDFFSLKGKTAIVTGGNSGLGRAFAVALAKAGADLFIPSIATDDGTTERLISEAGSKMEFMEVDITAEGAPKAVIDSCLERFDSVDIVVNSAGISKLGEVLEFDRKKMGSDATIKFNGGV